jgi:hypothetical protein
MSATVTVALDRVDVTHTFRGIARRRADDIGVFIEDAFAEEI